MESLDYNLKFVLVGDSGTGKSNLLLRFTQNKFMTDSTSTLGLEFSSKKISIDGIFDVNCQIWDTAGLCVCLLFQ